MPVRVYAFFSLANLITFWFYRVELDNMWKHVERVYLSLKNKAYFHFSLAQACETQGEYEEAFFHLERGNKIKSDQSKYSIEGMEKELQAQIDICNSSFFNTLGKGGHDTKDPLLILGLPKVE